MSRRPIIASLSLAMFALTAAGPAANHHSKISVDTADNPEPGKQGETMAGEDHMLARAYSHGVNLIGRSPIDGRLGNAIMTWSDHCAYVGDGGTIKSDGQLQFLPTGPNSGVAVIDVKDAAKPRVVRYLQDKGSLHAGETLHAVTTRKRSVLAASTYGGVAGINGPKEGWLSLYDVTKCDAPRLLSEIQWPEPVHTLRVSPDARYVYGTVLNPFTGEGGVEIMDITNPTRPHFLGKFPITAPDGKSYGFAPHEATFSPDQNRVYVGVLSSRGGDLNKQFKPSRPGMPSPEAVGPDAGGIYIIDNTDFALRKPNPKLRLIGTAHKAGWHSPVQAKIGGKPYLVSAGELGACPGAWPRITEIADERNPHQVGEFRLEMNKPENCPPRTPMETATGGLVGRSGVASTHFQDVDSSDDTRLGVFSFMFAGLRIVDLRNPKKPTEIAYFKPGDPCMSHVHYRRDSGQIWFACNASGFYVIALKPSVRAAHRLPRPSASH